MGGRCRQVYKVLIEMEDWRGMGTMWPIKAKEADGVLLW